MKPSRRSIGAALATALTVSVVLSGCSGGDEASTSTSAPSGTSNFPITVSSCGQDYTYDRAPERVLLGAPGTINTLDALGVSDSAIGYALGEYADGEQQRFPNLTKNVDGYAPSREFVVSTQPDLFLTSDEQQLMGEGSATKGDLTQSGGGIYVLGDYCANKPAQTTVDAVYRDVSNLGRIYGIPKKAAGVVANLKQRVEMSRARNTRHEKLTAAAVQIADNKVYALSGANYAMILNALGMENVFADLGQNFAEVSREVITRSDPDVVFVSYLGGNAQRGEAISAVSALFANSSAVKDGRVVGWRDSDFQAAGVNIVKVIEESAEAVWPHGGGN